MWTVYDHPLDFPEHFVARMWIVDGDGQRPTDTVITAETLDALRDWLADHNLTPLPRNAADEPQIVETWL